MPRLVSLLFHDVYGSDPAESGFDGPVANRYKLPRASFDALVAAVAAARPRVVAIRRDADIPPGDSLAVTVDDGGASFAGFIADRLEREGWRGHCFMTTGMMGRPGFLTSRELRDLDARGHVIGSHSVTHPARFGAVAWSAMLEEWRASRARLEDVLGHDVRVASLPGGALSVAAARAAAEAGLSVLFTSEPVARPWTIEECTLLGRFTVLESASSAALAALASGATTPLARQWIAWSAKKALKPVLRGAYPKVAAAWARAARTPRKRT